MERSVYITIRGDEVSVEARQDDGQTFGVGIANGAQPVAYIETPRFAKLDANGNVLSNDAPSWAAVLDREQQLIWSAADVCAATTWGKAKAAAEAAMVCGEPGRLATVRELLGIVDYECVEPAIDTTFFRDTQSRGYWTSSEAAGHPSSAWVVDFYVGCSLRVRRGSGCCVRAVRSVVPAVGQ